VLTYQSMIVSNLLCSTEGISLVTEVSCYAAVTAYAVRKGYSAFLWGSEAACWLQDSALITMLAVLRGLPVVQTCALVAGWLVLQAVLFTDRIPMWLLTKFQVRPISAIHTCAWPAHGPL
jgi:hypothetical protein